ncbi:MAG: hypothetical protein ACI8YQ_001416 [Polaribacter sp.]|jgi:hypothetical protein
MQTKGFVIKVALEMDLYFLPSYFHKLTQLWTSRISL